MASRCGSAPISRTLFTSALSELSSCGDGLTAAPHLDHLGPSRESERSRPPSAPLGGIGSYTTHDKRRSGFRSSAAPIEIPLATTREQYQNNPPDIGRLGVTSRRCSLAAKQSGIDNFTRPYRWPYSAEMAHHLVFGKIHIIEWLWNTHPDARKPERRTGKELHEELCEMIAETKSPMQVILHRVTSRRSFLKRLKRIEEDFATS
jgi:hypothetical protein